MQSSPRRRSITRSPGRAARPSFVQPARPHALPQAAFAHDQDLQLVIEQDQHRIDAAKAALAAQRARQRRAHDASLADLAEQGRRSDRERVRLEQVQREALKDQTAEQSELGAASELVKALELRQRALASQLSTLRTDLGDCQSRTAAIASDRVSQRDAIREQTNRNDSELALLETHAGCRVRPDVVTFTLLSPGSRPTQLCAFDLDLSGNTFAVVPSMPQQVASLNASHDLGSFVNGMRRDAVL